MYIVRLDPVPAVIAVPSHIPEIVVLRSEVHHPRRTAEPAPSVNCPVRHDGKAAGGRVWLGHVWLGHVWLGQAMAWTPMAWKPMVWKPIVLWEHVRGSGWLFCFVARQSTPSDGIRTVSLALPTVRHCTVPSRLLQDLVRASACMKITPRSWSIQHVQNIFT